MGGPYFLQTDSVDCLWTERARDPELSLMTYGETMDVKFGEGQDVWW